MASIMTGRQLAEKAAAIASGYKTLYVMGCFGAPMTAANKQRYTTNHAYNKDPTRTAMIKAASSDTFGFDCVCLIKGILWGWKGELNSVYGGAKYAANGVPDYSADGMIGLCSGVSTDFGGIQVGEAVWLKGHIGIYIGDGLAVECTPKWANKVQITAVGNLGGKAGYNTRTWTKHGKLPWVDYSVQAPAPQPDQDKVFPDVPADTADAEAISWGVENGLFSVGSDGYFYPDAGITRGMLAQALHGLYKQLK